VARISFAVLIFLLASGASLAADPRIENLSATSAAGKVTVHFTLSGAFVSDAMGQ